MSIFSAGIAVLIALVAVASWRLQKLTEAGAACGACIGWALLGGMGVTALIFMAVFFVSAVVATSIGKKGTGRRHNELGLERRTAGQVLANGGLAGLFGFAGLLWPVHQPILLLLTAAAFSSATADTVSSELGSRYGKRFYHVLTFRPDTKGLDGVISLEGTLFGIGGSLLIAFAYSTATGQWSALPVVLICGTFGNVLDSVLGAILERRGFIGNNVVNFLNTLGAALLALIL